MRLRCRLADTPRGPEKMVRDCLRHVKSWEMGVGPGRVDTVLYLIPRSSLETMAAVCGHLQTYFGAAGVTFQWRLDGRS